MSVFPCLDLNGNRFAQCAERFLSFYVCYVFRFMKGSVVAEILLLCGKVGSGKTFYADRLDSSGRFFKLSCDDLMLSLFDLCPGPEKHSDMLSRCKKYLAGVALRLLNAGKNVVLDYGFWTVQERRETGCFFSSAGHKVCIIYFDTDEKTAGKNLETRNAFLKNTGERGYIIDAGMKSLFDSRFEEPLPEECAVTAFGPEDPFFRSLD